nr:MAG TPA: Tail tape measure [Caudoviricetes sp.]
MADHQDVELRIRATNYSKQTTDKVVDALKEMTKAQDAQIESAKKGTTNVAALEASYKKLEAAAQGLLSQLSVTKLYEAQSKTLADLKAKVDAARAAQQAYADSLPAGADRTKKQQDELNKLGRALANTERLYLKAENTVAGTARRMGEFGITAANLAASQQKIREAVTQANAALERQERAINSTDAAAAAIAQREQQVRVDNIFAQAERDLARQLEATAAAQRAANLAANIAQRERQVEVDVIFANAERKATEEINKKNAALRAQQLALRAAADQAERMMRSSLVQARGRTPVQAPDLAGQIRDIANPADAAVRSIAGIDRAIAGLESRFRGLRQPVQDYRGALEDTRRAQAALSAVAGQVDTLQRQKQAVAAARMEYSQARRTVAELIAQMRAGNQGDDITTRLAQSQRTMQQAAQNLGNLTTQARATRAALQAAGVDTRNLAQAESDLVAQANRAAQALDRLTQAHRRNGDAGNQAGSRIWNWFGGNGGRTTLSFMQRLRGEVLALGAGFVGLNASINLAQSTITSFKANQAIMSRLLIANGGDARQAGLDYAYLEQQADRIGFVFQRIAPAFTKFAIAARSANFSTQETRFIFENIAESAVKARLSTEELEGVFKAFEQILSKGTVQAEELRGQLGDRLPGAFQIAARAAGKTVEEYTKMMELGQVSADQVIGIARELGKTYGTVSEGTTNLLAAEARFENAANRFRTKTAEGGFIEAYTEFLTKLTALLDGGEGDRLANTLSAGFAAVIGVITTVAENIDTLKFAVGALIGIGLVKWLIGLPLLFRAVAAEVALANGAMVTFNGLLASQAAAARLSLALGATGLTGVVARLTLALTAAGTALSALYRLIPVIGLGIAAYQGTSFIMDKMDDKYRDEIVSTMKATMKATQEADEAQRAYAQARGTKEEAALKEKYERQRNIAVAAIKAEGRAIEKARKENIDFEPLRAQAAASLQAAAPVAATEDPGNRPEDQLKRLRKELEKEDARSAKNLRAQRLKSAKEELADRLAIVDETFQVRREQAEREIKDADKLQEALKMINASSLKAQAVERAKFNNEQARKGQEAANTRIRLEESVSERLAKIQEDLANREGKADPTIPYEQRRAAAVGAVQKAYRELENDIAKYAKANPKQAAADLARTAELRKQNELLAGQNSDRKEAERLAKQFEDTQTILTTQIQEINALYDAGRISATEQQARTNAAIAELGPGVAAAGEAALQFAERFRSIMDPVAFQSLVSGIRTGLATANGEALTAANNVNAQQARLNALLDQQKNKLDEIKTQRSLGMITSEQEASRTNEVTNEYKQSITETIDELVRLLAVTQQVGGMSEEAFNKAKAAASQLKLETVNATTASTDLDRTIVNSVASNGVTAFEALATSIAEVAAGAQSIGDGFRGALSAVGAFFAKLLQDIAVAIIRQMILNTLVKALGASSGIGGAAVAAGGASVGGTLFHGGGVVGKGRGLVRNVPVEAFANAQRYHTGGLAGFRPNEVPAILEKNEEVLTRDDPRHVLNGGKSAGAAGGVDGGTRVVVVDDRQSVPEAMNSSSGERVIMAHIKNNLPTIKSLLRS